MLGIAIFDGAYLLWPHISTLTNAIKFQEKFSYITTALTSLTYSNPIITAVTAGAAMGVIYSRGEQRVKYGIVGSLITGGAAALYFYNNPITALTTQHPIISFAFYGIATGCQIYSKYVNPKEYTLPFAAVASGIGGAALPSAYFYQETIKQALISFGVYAAQATVSLYGNPLTYWAIGGTALTMGTYYVKTHGIKPMLEFKDKALKTIKDFSNRSYRQITHAVSAHPYITLSIFGPITGLIGQQVLPYTLSTLTSLHGTINSLEFSLLNTACSLSVSLGFSAIYRMLEPVLTLINTIYGLRAAVALYGATKYAHKKYINYKEQQKIKLAAQHRDLKFRGSTEQLAYKDLSLLFGLLSNPAQKDFLNMFMKDQKFFKTTEKLLQEYGQILAQVTAESFATQDFSLYHLLPINTSQIVQLGEKDKDKMTVQKQYKDIAKFFDFITKPENIKFLERFQHSAAIKKLMEIYPKLAADSLKFAFENNLGDVIRILPINSVDLTKAVTEASGRPELQYKSYNRYLLHHLVEIGDILYVKELLEMLGKNHKLINAQDSKGWTPLHYATINAGNDGEVKLIKLLLQYAAIPDKKDKKEFTPAFYSAGQKEVLKVLGFATFSRTILENLRDAVMENARETYQRKFEAELELQKAAFEKKKSKLAAERAKLETEMAALQAANAEPPSADISALTPDFKSDSKDEVGSPAVARDKRLKALDASLAKSKPALKPKSVAEAPKAQVTYWQSLITLAGSLLSSTSANKESSAVVGQPHTNNTLN